MIEIPYTVLRGSDNTVFHEVCVDQHDKKREGAYQLSDINIDVNDVCNVCGVSVLQAPRVPANVAHLATEADIRRAIDNEGKGPRGARGELLSKYPSGQTREETEAEAQAAAASARGVTQPAPVPVKPAGVTGQPPQRPTHMPTTTPGSGAPAMPPKVSPRDVI